MSGVNQRMRAVALLGLAFAITEVQAFSQDRPAEWRTIEQQTRGDLQRMLQTLDRLPGLQQMRLSRSARELAQLMQRAGRFRDLGLSEQEGVILTEAVYRKLGLPFEREEKANEVRSNAPAIAPLPDLRAATEFEPLAAVLLRWPHDWPALTDEYVELVKAFVAGGVKVQIRVDTAKQRTLAEQQLAGAAVPPNALQWIIQNTDSIWIRDYGPQFLVAPSGRIGAVADFHYYRYRPNDDKTPVAVAESINVPVIDRQSAEVVYTEGGNLMHDGLGTVIFSERTYSKNRTAPGLVDQRILSAFNATRAVVLPDMTLDSTGHVDMFMKLIDAETVLVGQYQPGQVDYAALEVAAARLAMLTNGAGKRVRVVRIPQPDVYYSHFAVPVVRTYTNAQVANGIVIVPVYGIPSDETALAIYRSLFPKRKVTGVKASDIIESGGAWHCVAMEMPGKPL